MTWETRQEYPLSSRICDQSKQHIKTLISHHHPTMFLHGIAPIFSTLFFFFRYPSLHLSEDVIINFLQLIPTVESWVSWKGTCYLNYPCLTCNKCWMNSGWCIRIHISSLGSFTSSFTYKWSMKLAKLNAVSILSCKDITFLINFDLSQSNMPAVIHHFEWFLRG